MGVRAFSESTYLSALALRSLGREVESEKLLRDLLDYARKLAKSPAKIDYFATSLPAMLLFDDDLQHRQTIHARFLEAQAHLGLGEKSLAEKSLKEILRDDPNYTPAADLLSSLNTEETHAIVKSLAVILMCAFIATWFGCSKQTSDKITIGYIVKQPDQPWFQNEWKFAQQAADQYGFDLEKWEAKTAQKVVADIDRLGTMQHRA